MLRWILALGLVLGMAGAQAQAATRLIVRFDQAATDDRRQPTAEQRQRLAQATGLSLRQTRTLSGGAVLLEAARPLTPAQAETAARAIAAQPGVLYAHPDHRRKIAQAAPIPSDADYSAQWYLQPPHVEIAGIDAATAWATTTGESAVFRPVVAVLDSGIRFHPELDGQYADDGDGLPGYDFISADADGSFSTANDGDGRDGDPSDPGDWLDRQTIAANDEVFAGCEPSPTSSWHGTAVAGIIGATPDTNFLGNQGTVGVHFAPRILPVRVLGRCGGFISDIAEGIRWAAGLPVDDPSVPINAAPARIINLSFGAEGACSATEQAAIDAATAAGALVIAAAGNVGGSGDFDAANSAPGNCRNVLTVAASTRAGGRTSYTKFSISASTVDLSAPGGDGGFFPVENNILAPSNAGTTRPLEHSYEFLTGTSFSAPMVSGAAALALSLNNRLSPACVQDALLAGARAFPAAPVDGSAACSNATCGAGLLDARATLAVVDAMGPGDCGSTSSSGGGGASWALVLLGLLGVLSLRRARKSTPPCRSPSPASCRRCARQSPYTPG